MRDRRGFIMIIVLLVVVALVAAVIGVQSIVQHQRQASQRDFDQVRARAIGDHCLQRARMYIDQIRNDVNPADFDKVLDPELDSHPASTGGADSFDDDFVPGASFGGVITYLPTSEAGQTGLRQALHRYRYVEMDGGGCFVRFDDNSDDNRVGQGSDNADPDIEGFGNDIPYRDRDIGILISAIGIYPAAPGTPPEDAYHRARARMSLRVFVNTGGAPGVVARDDLNVENNVAICGQGGFQGDNLTYQGAGNSTTVCACGDTATVSGATQPSDCNYSSGPGDPCDDSIPCQPGAATSLSAPPDPDVKVPTPVHWLELDGFQDPLHPQSLGQNGVCEFYFRHDDVNATWKPGNLNVPNNVEATFMDDTNEFSEIFVWDHTDNDAQGCREDKTLFDCAPEDLVTHDCRFNTDTTYFVDENGDVAASGRPVVKRPCRWSKSEQAVGPRVQCRDDDMTPCWKLVARISTNAGEPAATAFDPLSGPIPALGAVADTARAATNIVQQDFALSVSGGSPTASSFVQKASVCEPDCTGGQVCVRRPTETDTSRMVCVDPSLRDVREDTTEKGTRFSEVFSPFNAPVTRKQLDGGATPFRSGDQRVPNIEMFWGDPPAAGAAAGTPTSKNDGTKICDGDGKCEQGELGGPCTDCDDCVNDGVCGSTEESGCYDCAGGFWDQLCGKCPNCANAEGWGNRGDEHIHFEQDPMCTADFFDRAILVFENQVGSLAAGGTINGRFHVKENWGRNCNVDKNGDGDFADLGETDVPVRHTVLVQGHADIDLNTRICGTWSDCTTFPAPCTRASRGLASGLVFRAGGICYVGDGALFTGNMQCATIHIDNSPTATECSAGSLIAFNDDVKVPSKMGITTSINQCPAIVSPYVDSCDNGICTNQQFALVGDMISSGDICIKLGATIFGSVLGGGAGPNEGNVYIESGVTINGQLVSEGDIGIKTNTIINNNGVGTFGTRVTSGILSETAY